MSDQAIANYVKLCRSYGVVKADGTKSSLVVVMPDGICWLETYSAMLGYGTWLCYPARGVQVRIA